MKNPYSLRKKELSYQNILLIDSNCLNSFKKNIEKNNNNKKIDYLYTMMYNSKDLIDNADHILKERKNNAIMPNQLEKRKFMENVEEIRLENYKIKMLKNKRIELNDKILDIKNAIQTSERVYKKDYDNFLDFVEKNDKSQKNLI